ncbi:MAG: hypothetical protein ABIC95_06920 [archaeon]
MDAHLSMAGHSFTEKKREDSINSIVSELPINGIEHLVVYSPLLKFDQSHSMLDRGTLRVFQWDGTEVNEICDHRMGNFDPENYARMIHEYMGRFSDATHVIAAQPMTDRNRDYVTNSLEQITGTLSSQYGVDIKTA